MSHRQAKAARRAARKAKASRDIDRPRRSVYEVDITTVYEPADEYDPEETGWSAMAGVRHDSAGVQFGRTTNLAEIADEVARVERARPIVVRYTLDGEQVTLTDLQALAATSGAPTPS